MNQTTTIKEIAEKLNLSVSTVSRVLNGIGRQYRISKKTIALVQKTAEEYNFEPNVLARSLRLKKTFTIGVLVPDISNPFFSKFASIIEREARKLNYSTLICASDDDTLVEQKSLNILINRKVDGILATPIGIESSHFIKAYNKGIPLVLIDRFFRNKKIPYITFDDRLGAYNATRLLLENGHKRIACIQGLRETSSNFFRLEGYKEALTEFQIPVDSHLIVGDNFGEENGYNQAKYLLEMPVDERPTAIFASSNLITLGVLKFFKENNVKVPQDFSIVSFDEQEYSALLYTPITTIVHSNHTFSRKAIDMLLLQINSEEILPFTNEVFPTSLILRDSVKKIG